MRLSGKNSREGRGTEMGTEPRGRGERFGARHLALVPPFALVPRDWMSDTVILSLRPEPAS